MSPDLNPSSVQNSKNVLIADLERVVSDADDLMKEVLNATSEEFTERRQQIAARMDTVKTKIDEARLLAKRRVCDAANSTQRFVEDNPWAAIGFVSALTVVGTLLLIQRADHRRHD
jgi:ElaB/YqjD/DUF883 family membrane-anchored ribosome-binding protein